MGIYDLFRVDGPGERTLLRSVERCTPLPWLDEPGDGEPAGLSGAAARGVIRELLPLPEPSLSPPSGHAITGLETWVWYDDAGGELDLQPVERNGVTTLGATVSDTAGPYTIEATVWIEEYRWDMGDGTTVTSSRPGTEDDPAATHTYRTKSDDYQVVSETVWRGTYTWTAPGGAGGSGDMGSLTVVGDPVDYPVVEVRAVPAQPDG